MEIQNRWFRGGSADKVGELTSGICLEGYRGIRERDQPDLNKRMAT